MAELAYAPVSETGPRKGLWVRLPPVARSVRMNVARIHADVALGSSKRIELTSDDSWTDRTKCMHAAGWKGTSHGRFALVAQLDGALAFEARCRRFESCRERDALMVERKGSRLLSGMTQVRILLRVPR